MKKILPYAYFVIAAVWLIDGINKFIQPAEVYHIFLDYSTESKYNFLIFKLLIGVLVILAGIRRLKMSKQ